MHENNTQSGLGRKGSVDTVSKTVEVVGNHLIPPVYPCMCPLHEADKQVRRASRQMAASFHEMQGIAHCSSKNKLREHVAEFGIKWIIKHYIGRDT